MNDALPFLIRHGYAVLFLWVLAEQLGLPLPATPFIIAAGALAHLGQMNFGVAILLATVASVMADLSWYQIGRLRGVKVLHVLCRISLEPDYCVRRTENSFTRHGAKTLLIAKFVPGVSTVAPALALGVDPAEAGLMQKPPRARNEGVITRRMWVGIFFVGAITAAGTLLVLSISPIVNRLELNLNNYLRSPALATLVFCCVQIVARESVLLLRF